MWPRYRFKACATLNFSILAAKPGVLIQQNASVLSWKSRHILIESLCGQIWSKRVSILIKMFAENQWSDFYRRFRLIFSEILHFKAVFCSLRLVGFDSLGLRQGPGVWNNFVWQRFTVHLDYKFLRKKWEENVIWGTVPVLHRHLDHNKVQDVSALPPLIHANHISQRLGLNDRAVTFVEIDHLPNSVVVVAIRRRQSINRNVMDLMKID